MVVPVPVVEPNVLVEVKAGPARPQKLTGEGEAGPGRGVYRGAGT